MVASFPCCRTGAPLRLGSLMPRTCKPKPDADAARRAYTLPGWASVGSAGKCVYGESIASAFLAAAAGLSVWRPLSAASPADLAVVRDGRLVPLQVRVASYVPDSDSFRASFRRRRGGKAVRYAREDVSAFLVVCPTSPAAAVYCVPAAVVAGRASGTFVPHRARQPRKGAYDWERFRGAVHLLK